MVNNSESFTYHAINLRKKKDKTNYFGVFFTKIKKPVKRRFVFSLSTGFFLLLTILL